MAKHNASKFNSKLDVNVTENGRKNSSTTNIFGTPKVVAEPGYVTPAIAQDQNARRAVKKKLTYSDGELGQPPAKIGHEVRTSPQQPFRDLDDADLLNEQIWAEESKKIAEFFQKSEEERLLLARKKKLAEARLKHQQNEEQMEFIREEIAGWNQER